MEYIDTGVASGSPWSSSCLCLQVRLGWEWGYIDYKRAYKISDKAVLWWSLVNIHGLSMQTLMVNIQGDFQCSLKQHDNYMYMTL